MAEQVKDYYAHMPDEVPDSELRDYIPNESQL